MRLLASTWTAWRGRGTSVARLTSLRRDTAWRRETIRLQQPSLGLLNLSDGCEHLQLIVMLILGVLFLLFIVNCPCYLSQCFIPHPANAVDVRTFIPYGPYWNVTGDLMSDIDWHLHRSVRGSVLSGAADRFVLFGHAEGPIWYLIIFPHRVGRGNYAAIFYHFSHILDSPPHSVLATPTLSRLARVRQRISRRRKLKWFINRQQSNLPHSNPPTRTLQEE